MPSSKVEKANVLFKCALYYGDAHSDEEFNRARAVLAESAIRSYCDGVPKCAIRIHTLDGPLWREVTEAAIKLCDAYVYDDVTVPLNDLCNAAKRWATTAKWTPEPWRTT